MVEITGRAPIGGATHGVIVDEDGRAYVNSVTRATWLDAAEAGRAFWVHSGFTALTSASGYSGLLYIKNTHAENEIHVGNLRTCGDATGHTKARIYKNPTAGTLITAGTGITPVNAKFSSNNTLSSDSIKGADGLTITDGTMMGTWIDATAGHSVSELQGTVIMGPGDSVALEIQPSVDMNCCTTWQVWFEKPHVTASV